MPRRRSLRLYAVLIVSWMHRSALAAADCRRLTTRQWVCSALIILALVAAAVDVLDAHIHWSLGAPALVVAAILLWPRPDGIEFSQFVWFWITTLALPLGLLLIDSRLAVITGIATPVIWGVSMPVGCMGGAFAAFPMLGVQLASLAFWIGRLPSILKHTS
jgi:hypothetical protein